ncbi:MAG: hypothetical protein U0271_27530 [Polyangiaceae bacterium]
MNLPSRVQALRSVAALGACALTMLSVYGCFNPVADEQIEALGGELANVPPSEYHRPGQPCVVCHGVYGGESPSMVLGGTVFADQRSFLPVEGAEVVIYDSVGDVYTMTSNCIGNFWLERGDKIPQFPLAAEIRCPTYDANGNPLEGVKVRSMNSWISRDGSCATCHSLRGTQVDSTGWLFCNDPDERSTNVYPPVAEECPGEPPKVAGEDNTGGATP